jgi:tyrosyl-tRNA synthetase
MSVLDELSWRGLLQDATEGAADHLAEPRAGYIGFDPTAASLHVGHLLAIMGLVHLQRAGHHPIALVGGATGLIGDPSGKSAERNLLTPDVARENGEAIRAQLEPFLDFEASGNPARMRNNLDWLGKISLIDFLRDVGKHFSVNAMLRKESVKRRIEDEESGISFTEFSYQLLQAYDFARLCEDDQCTLQLGGSDQWGNITAGIDLVRRLHGQEAHGVVFPLVTNSAGKKFGKTEEGAVWLDPEWTSPFRFFQFWINTTDEDAGRYLRYFTLLGREEVEALEAQHAEEPWKRVAQKRLAADVTGRVHGEDGLARARRATDALFGGDLDGLAAAEIADVFSDVPSSDMRKAAFEGGGIGIVDLLADAGVASSKGEARRAVEGGGIYVNAVRVESVDTQVTLERAIEGRFLVLRKGKKHHHLVRVD